MSSTAVKDRFADYVPVSERLEQFYSDHPEGRVLTTIVEHDAENGFILMRAEIYRAIDDATPMATGHAFENRTEGFVNKTSYIENCETSATGRALALAGYEIKRGIASREEMEKTERMNGGDKPKEDAMVCPACNESKAVINSKPEYGGGYLCFKKKGGCGAKWGAEPKTEGFDTDAARRNDLFIQAEKILVAANVPEEKRKEKLGHLLGIRSTDEMEGKVRELLENAKKKLIKKTNELAEDARKKALAADPVEEDRLAKIREIRRDAKPDVIDKYLADHFKGKTLEELSADAVIQVHAEMCVPF